VRKILALVAVALLAFGLPAAAAAAAPEPPAIGNCISKSTGINRTLEKTNLAKSQYGKCRTTETKVTLPTVRGVKALLPAKQIFTRTAPPLGSETCTKNTTASTASTWVWTCVNATPSPPASPAAS
jgi:hypothetical protein